MSLLRVEHLRKEYQGHGAAPLVAVDDVSLSVEAGDSLAIVGESGSGKTTCARIITGLETATSGSVEIDGASPGRKRGDRMARARRVQMVFQDPYSSLDPRQTVRSAIAEVLALHGARDGRARAARTDELLEKVGLDPRIGASLPRRLSGGQRQRVAIARALAAAPRLLILDEAVAALDVSVQAQVLNLLADLRAADGLTSVFISHDLGVVRQVSSHCVVMHRGVIVERGSTSQILDAPAHPYTRRLLAAVPRPGWKPRLRAAGQREAGQPEPEPEPAHENDHAAQNSPRTEPERTR
jgi:ABC-type glutathione transport system ATPase component